MWLEWSGLVDNDSSRVREGWWVCKRLQLLKGFWLLQLSEIESHPMALSKGQTRSHLYFYRLILQSRPGWQVVTQQVLNTSEVERHLLMYWVWDVRERGIFPITTLTYKFNFLIWNKMNFRKKGSRRIVESFWWSSALHKSVPGTLVFFRGSEEGTEQVGPWPLHLCWYLVQPEQSCCIVLYIGVLCAFVLKKKK